jgi:toxin ParE1/3/4
VKLRLSDAAKADIREIRAYTLRRWGAGQWRTYNAGLQAALARIEADPGCGIGRESLRAGMRSLGHVSHVLFFLTAAVDGAPFVLRILHHRQNVDVLRDPALPVHRRRPAD